MLYVEADNEPARLCTATSGFVEHQAHRWWRRRSSPDASASARSLDRMRSVYDLDRDALAALLADQPRYRVDQVWQGLYEQAAPDRRADRRCPRRCGPGSPTSCPGALRPGHRVGQPTTARR